ncbi:MAG: hypothetical protein ACW976_01670 [Candidatus Ranarchaeia archaeon]
MSKSKSKPMNNNGFEWRKNNLEPTLEGEQKQNSPQLPIPVNKRYFAHRDPSVKSRRRITQAFAHHRLSERLM